MCRLKTDVAGLGVSVCALLLVCARAAALKSISGYCKQSTIAQNTHSVETEVAWRFVHRCKPIPGHETGAESESESEAEAEPESEPESEAEAEPETESEPEAEDEAEAEAEGETEAEGSGVEGSSKSLAFS